jgi:N-acetylglucosaminyldiphosphoundecaprenol N-acetyl-beta-D-mannosaminyltransferase
MSNNQEGAINNIEVKTVEIFGFKVFSDDLDKIPLNNTVCGTINTISPNSYGISTKDALFRKALKESDYLVLDGVYFAMSSFLLKGKNIKKNQGPDVFYHFMKRMNAYNGKIFFLGASEATLKKIEIRCKHDYPNISVASLSPPFKPEFTDIDNQKMINAVNAFAPDILFIGLTAPKQEKWAFLNKEKLNTKLAISIGGVFDWYAGNEKGIAPIWWKLRLAWLIRTIQRPEILKRYPDIFIFFKHLGLALIGIKKY